MDINTHFNKILLENDYVDQHNFLVSKLAPTLQNELTIHHTDSIEEVRSKRKKAKNKIKYYGYFYPLYPVKHDSETEPSASDADVGEVAFLYPNSLGPEQDDEYIQKEAMSSTERVRRYYRRHPEKVRRYLKKTQADRVARNRDRRKAVKKYGKSKMKNHDVHHPNGARNGNWRLARKDHGRDKKNENIEYVYLSELMDGNVPNGPWELINEGGAAGHLAHPYEDNSLTFADIKEMIKRGLVGGLDAEAPVTEKLDGQNITFSVRDGQVVFARNKGQIKNRGKNALPAADLRQMFAGRGDIEKAFGNAADDLQGAISALSPEQVQQMFGDGSKFMNVEIIFPDTKNVIPYDKSVLVFHGTIEYDEDGNELGRDINAGKILSDAITKVNAQKQRTFGISGPKTISFNDADTATSLKKLKDYGALIRRMQDEFDLDDRSTIEDYKKARWAVEIDNMGINWTPEEREGLITRWATGAKKFGVKDIKDPEKKALFREFEKEELKQMQKKINRPLESLFLRVGADTLQRVTNFLSANNPEVAASLKKELLDTIQQLRDSGSERQLAILQTQIERLDDIGIDNIVPSEGLVFMYNGNPYKFTGAFAPVNQILGVLKFQRGGAELTDEEPTEPPTEKPTDNLPDKPIEPEAPTTPKKTVVVFAGRFQPFHTGHYSVYQSLVKKFGKENVFLASSGKTDPITSPFDFNDRKEIITQMFDVPEDQVIETKNPYAPSEILSKLPPETTYVTAVSEKDAERLAQTGYYRPYNPKIANMPYADQGYFVITPELKLDINGKNVSGTQLRSIFGNPNITERAKQEIFTMVYGKFNKDIFQKIVNVTTDSEEARELTDMYGKRKANILLKTKVPGQPIEVPQEKPKRSRKKQEDEPKSPDHYKPGETWETEGGNFGAKNSKNQFKYFNTLDKAKQFAKT